MATSRIADHVGRVLGDRYRLIAPIGTGASAHVFLAEDVKLRRRVAVKILHAALADDEAFLRRFRAEAQAAAALNHPNIMKVFDWGEDDDGPYLVLEYLGGGSLRDLLDKGTLLTPAQATNVGLEAARALEYAHRRGLVHRDIKPANLLFDEEGRLRIADFGLARALAEAAWTEPAGAVLGTARYASPEQAQGAKVTGGADVYSLALVLVETVTGRVPFSADTTIATLMARVGAQLEAPDVLGPLGPPVERAADPEADDRYDAATFVRALERVAGDLPTPAPIAPAGAEVIDPTVSMTADPTLLPAPGSGPFDVMAAGSAVGLAGARRRWPRRALALLALCAALALAAVGIVRVATPTRTVPEVTGVTLAAAASRARAAHLDVKVVSRRFDESVPKDQVISQDPVRGAHLKQGRTIAVVLSRGPAARTVPDLTGLDEAAATAALQDKGLVPKFSKRYDETVEKGKVLDWLPRGEQPKGAEIAVVISDGPEPRGVPDLRGQPYDDAAKALTDLGLKVKRVDVYDDDTDVGRVVSTAPGAGQKAERGSTVTVNVSKGPETVTVPDVVGMDVDDATATLEKAGLVVSGVAGPPKAKHVIYSDPQAGRKVKRGSGVYLYTAR